MRILLFPIQFTLALSSALPPCIGPASTHLPTTTGTIAARRPATLGWPRLPHLYRISDEPLFLNFTAYGPPISRFDGDLFIARIVDVLLRQIRIQGAHSPYILDHSFAYDNCYFRVSTDTLRGVIELGDLLTMIVGLARFFRQYGFVGAFMDLVGVPPERTTPETGGFHGQFTGCATTSES